MVNSETNATKAPAGTDAFSVIENALLQASLDAAAVINRRWPTSKKQARVRRAFADMKRKQRGIDQALIALDGMRGPVPVAPEPEGVKELPLFRPNGSGATAHGQL